MTPISEVKNEDCMVGMARYPDKFFELAVVDPPYGINHPEIVSKQSGKKYGVAAAPKSNYASKQWDIGVPSLDYFKELKRVSQHQIIWGANYMVEYLDASMGWIVWDKDNCNTGFSDCELAYTSFDKALRKFKFTWNGMIQGNMKNKEIKIHPTQKPVALYQWLLKNYAKPGDKILDTHLGSGSSRIAAYKLGFDFYGWELDSEYFEAQEKRFKESISQPLFDVNPIQSTQPKFF